MLTAKSTIDKRRLIAYIIIMCLMFGGSIYTVLNFLVSKPAGNKNSQRNTDPGIFRSPSADQYATSSEDRNSEGIIADEALRKNNSQTNIIDKITSDPKFLALKEFFIENRPEIKKGKSDPFKP